MKNLVEQRKEQKRNQILNQIRHSGVPLSRFDIKKSTQYSMTTVINTITDLIGQGMLLEDACVENNRMGRKPIFLHLNPDGGYFIGVEFNIQNMYCVVLDFAGEVIHTADCSTQGYTSTGQFIGRLKAQIAACLAFLGERRSRLLGIGLGLPGYIDMDRGIALSYAYIPDWTDIPIADMIEKEFFVPCYICNNVSSMCLAFKWLNQYRQEENFVFVSVRTGVRSILFMNGEPYLGRNCSSGELGHVKLDGCGRPCSCGQRGCLNTEVSVLALREKMAEGMREGKYQAVARLAGYEEKNLSVELLIQCALGRDAESAALIRDTAVCLGQALSTVVNLLAPPNIIVASPLCRTGELFLKPLEETVGRFSVPGNASHLRITPSPWGDNIGAIGAAALVMENKYHMVPSES